MPWCHFSSCFQGSQFAKILELLIDVFNKFEQIWCTNFKTLFFLVIITVFLFCTHVLDHWNVPQYSLLLCDCVLFPPSLWFILLLLLVCHNIHKCIFQNLYCYSTCALFFLSNTVVAPEARFGFISCLIFVSLKFNLLSIYQNKKCNYDD